jgi:hypothetical protein
VWASATLALAVALLALLVLPSFAAAAPANDDVANAQVIPGTSAELWFDLSGASVEPDENVSTSNYTRSVWFRWTATFTGSARLLVNSSQSNRVTMYTGPAADHTQLTELPAYWGIDEVGMRQVTSGTTYWIQIRDAGTTWLDRTRFTLNPQVLADNFDDQWYGSMFTPTSSGGDEVQAVTWTGAATREVGEPNHAGFAGNNTVWLGYYATSTGWVSVDTQNSDFDTVLGVYTGNSVSTLTQIAANDDVAAGETFSRVRINVTAGRQYHIAVSGKGTGSGTANVRVLAHDNFDNWVDADPFDAEPADKTGYWSYADFEHGDSTLEAGENHGVGRVHSVWQVFTPSVTTRIGCNLWTYDAPVSMRAFTGATIGTATLVATGPDVPYDSEGYFEMAATAGTTYHVALTSVNYRVASYADYECYMRQDNDDFATAKVITPNLSTNTTYTAMTLAATKEVGEPNHGAAATHSVWYSWTPATTSNVRLTTSLEDVDPMIAVYTGAAVNALTLVGSSDDAVGTRPDLTFTAVAGTTYRIAVDSKGTIGGSTRLNVQSAVAPANDLFANATVVPATGGTFAASTWGAGTEIGEPQHGTVVGGSSLWWNWTAPATRLIAIDTTQSSASSQVAVYTGTSVNALALVARSQDWNGTGRGRVEFVATAGTTYRIAIDLANNGDGDVLLDVEPPPSNDKFGGSVTLGAVGKAQTVTLGGSKQVGEPAHAGNAGGSSVWYSWTAPVGGSITFNTVGSDFDTLLGVYTGTAVDTLVGVVANDDAIGTASKVTFTATAGFTYRIAIDGKNDARGTAVLRWAPVASDTFASSQAIAGANVTTSLELGGTSLEIGEPAHAAGADGSAWFSWTAPATGIVGINSTGSAGDTILAAYTGAAVGSLTLVQANDDWLGGPAARLRFTATSGVTYRIALVTKDAVAGTAWLRLNEAPVNNNFASATAFTGSQETGHNFGSTAEVGEPNHAGLVSTRTVWWTWTAPIAGSVTFDTVGSDFDTILAVYTGGSVSTLTAVASNDDTAGIAPRSRVTFAAAAGTTYRIAVAGKANDMGDITLNMNAPGNDNMVNATAVAVGSLGIVGTTAGASTELFEPNVRTGTYSVWYKWTPGVSDRVSFELTSTGTGAAIYAYTGASVSTLSQLGVRETSTTLSRIQFDGIAGTTYWLQVLDRTATNFTLDIPTPPANDHLTGAVVLPGTVPSSAAGNTVGATYENAAISRRNSFYFAEPEVAGTNGYHGMWFRWTAPATQTVVFDASNNGRYQVFTGSDEDNLTNVSEDPVDGNSDLSPMNGLNRVNVTAATTYYIYVTHWNFASRGAITLSIATATGTPNDNFASSKVLINPSDWRSEPDYASTTCEVGEPNHGGLPCMGTEWYSWTSPVAGTGTISTESSDTGYDTDIAVYTGNTFGTLVQVTYNNNISASEVRSRVSWAMTAGVTYRIAVGRRTNTPGTLRATTGIMIANDNPATPTAVGTQNAIIPAQTRSTSVDTGDNTSAHSAWWRWTPTYTGVASTRLTNQSSNNFVQEYTGTVGSFVLAPTQVAPSVPTSYGTYGNGETGYDVTSGTPISLKAYASFTWWDDSFEIQHNQSSPNEAFASAWTIDPTTIRTVSDFLGAGSVEAGEPNHAGQVSTSTLWYNFTPTVTRTYRLDTHLSTTSLNTVLAVYTGSAVNALTAVASANNTLGTNQEHLTFNGVAGTTYRIAVGRIGAAGYGFATLRIDAPANDHSAAAVTLTGPAVTVSSTLANGYNDATEPAFTGSAGSSVWYKWVAPATGPTTIDTLSGTVFDTQLMVREGAVATTSLLVDQNDDYGGTNQSRVAFNATAGNTYWFLVASWGTTGSGYSLSDGIQAGEGDFTLRVLQSPSNDDFSAGTTLVGVTPTATTDNTLATFENGEPMHASVPGGASIWYYWTAPASSPVVIDTFGSAVDTTLAVYTGATVTSLTQVAANDDWNNVTQSRVTFNAIAGTVYRIAVDAFRADGGAVTLRVNAAPPNDNFVNAIALSGTSAITNGYNTNATSEVSEPAHAGFAATDSIWYTWTAPAAGSTTIDTFGSAIDTRLAIYTGASVGALTLVGQNDDTAPGTTSRVTFTAVAGTTYRIAIDGKSAANGDVRVRINAIAPSVPLLVSPANGASVIGLTPTLDAQFQHGDIAAVGSIQIELCRMAVAPADPWSTNCTTGYQVLNTAGGLSNNSIGSAAPPLPLQQAQLYWWRAKETDGSAWSGWSGNRSFTPQASITTTLSTLGYSDASRQTSGWGISFGLNNVGTSRDIGPVGSGQTLAGSAIDYGVSSDGTTTTTMTGATFISGVNSFAASQLQRKDRTAGETIQELAFTPFATTAQTVEQDIAGTITHSYDLRLTIPGGQPVGAYTSSVVITTVGSP